jgi:diguanylate cyclase (GGDEF)-like protein
MAESLFHYVLGRFQNRELEQRFEADVQDVDRRHAIRVLILIAIIYLAFLPIELVVLRGHQVIILVVAMRASFALFCAVLVAILRRSGRRARTDLVILLMVAAFCVASTVIYMYQNYMDRPTQGFMMATVTYLMATLASYALYQARFRYQVSYGLCFAVAFAVLTWLAPPAPGIKLVVIAMFFVITNVIGMAISARIHELRRMQWLALQQERQLGTDLKREIIRREALEEQLREQANTDPLTGIYNRRQFFLMGEEAVVQAMRYRRPLAAIVFDIDHFKRINDTYGHGAGDEVLKSIVGAISGILRKPDVFCRHGGEEFSILLPESDAVGASRLAERIRSAVEKLTIRVDDHSEHVTVSIGVAVLSPRDKDFGDLITRGDDALYTAKGKGRNTVVCAVS